MWKIFIGLIIMIFCSIVTNFGKLRTLNESDGDSENELLDITTDEYEGQGYFESNDLGSKILPYIPGLEYDDYSDEMHSL